MAKVKSKIEKNGTISITFSNLTLGEGLALKHALENYARVSPVGQDVSEYLNSELNSNPSVCNIFKD